MTRYRTFSETVNQNVGTRRIIEFGRLINIISCYAYNILTKAERRPDIIFIGYAKLYVDVRFDGKKKNRICIASV